MRLPPVGGPTHSAFPKPQVSIMSGFPRFGRPTRPTLPALNLPGKLCAPPAGGATHSAFPKPQVSIMSGSPRVGAQLAPRDAQLAWETVHSKCGRDQPQCRRGGGWGAAAEKLDRRAQSTPGSWWAQAATGARAVSGKGESRAQRRGSRWSEGMKWSAFQAVVPGCQGPTLRGSDQV